MRCLFYSYCDEPKYLCCNFCSNNKCEKRCKDDCIKCKYHESGSVEIDDNKSNHIIKKKPKEEIIKAIEGSPLIKKGRGRPKKEILVSTERMPLPEFTEIKRGRGRPKKSHLRYL